MFKVTVKAVVRHARSVILNIKHRALTFPNCVVQPFEVSRVRGARVVSNKALATALRQTEPTPVLWLLLCCNGSGFIHYYTECRLRMLAAADAPLVRELEEDTLQRSGWTVHAVRETAGLRGEC